MLNKQIRWSDSLSYDHGRGSRGGNGGIRPPEFGVGDANANCPPQILHIGPQRSVLWPSKYTKTVFLAGALSRTPLGELTTLPHIPYGWEGTPLGREHPFPYPTPLGTDPLSALAMRPPEFQPCSSGLWL